MPTPIQQTPSRFIAPAVVCAVLWAVSSACEERPPRPAATAPEPKSPSSKATLVVRLSDGRSLDGTAKPSITDRAAERGARDALSADAAPALWHVWGRRLVVVGDYEAGIDALEEARRGEPSRAVLHDLAAARLLTASTTRSAEHWVRALDTALALRAMHAGTGGADLVSAAWHGWLGDEDGAAARQLSLAWIEKEKTSDLLALVRVDVQRAREWVEDSALPAWADEHLAGRPAAASRWLDAARRVAEALEAASGDRTDRDAVAAIDDGRRPARDALAGMHVTWRTGRRQFASDAMSDMRRTFRSFRHDRPSHPLAGWGACYEAIGRYYGGDIAGAEALLAATLGGAPDSARSLRARLLWIRGTLHFHRARFELAVSNYTAASRELAAIPEPANRAVVEHLLADAYESLGDTRRVWHHFANSLGPMSRHPEARRRFAAWTGAGIAADKQGLNYASAAFLERALDEARRAGMPAARTDALHRVALARKRLGQDTSAQDAIIAAMASANEVTDVGLRAKFGADLLSSRALLALDSAPVQAEQFARQALTKHRVVRSTFATIEVRLLLAKAQRAQGRGRHAERTLASALAEIERRRELTRDTGLRLSYLQAYARGYEEMVALQADDLSRPDDALGTAERVRARGLLDLASRTSATAVLHPLDVARQLPHTTKLLYLATTDACTYAWVLGRKDVQFRRLDIGRTEAARLLARLRSYLADGRTREAAVVSTRLHRLVVTPFDRALRETQRLVVVGDPIWQQAPFAAWRPSSDGPYLAERLALISSPSASILSVLLQRPATRVPQVAVFAAGTPPKGIALATLPNLERESRDVVRLYQNATTYGGADATRERFLQALERHQVVHFSGHALRASRPDAGSALVFGDGLVSAGDLEGLRVRAPVVVLGGCSTASGRPVDGEGLMGLARPLLAGGARVVIASLWDVDDRSTSVLLVRFHAALVATHDAAEALREAQVAMLREGSSQGAIGWASFVVIGT